MACAILIFLGVDRWLYPRFTQWWWGRADVIWTISTVGAVGAPSAQEAALRFVDFWVNHPGEALLYVSRDERLEIDHPAFREPALPEMRALMMGQVLDESEIQLLQLTPIAGAAAAAHLVEIQLHCDNFMRGARYEFVVVRGARGRWFAAAPGLEARTRHYLAIFNNGPWDTELRF